VTTNNSGGWTARSNEAWITGVTASGLNGEDLYYSVAANPYSYERKGYIVVSANGALRTFTVTQAGGAATLSLSSMSTTVDHGSSSYTGPVVYTNYSSWTAWSNASWITGVTASGTNGQSLRYNVDVNNSNSHRSGTITVSANGKSVTLSVTQRYYGYDVQLAGSVSGNTNSFQSYCDALGSGWKAPTREEALAAGIPDYCWTTTTWSYGYVLVDGTQIDMRGGSATKRELRCIRRAEK
jgi:hypothetical protein